MKFKGAFLKGVFAFFLAGALLASGYATWVVTASKTMANSSFDAKIVVTMTSTDDNGNQTTHSFTSLDGALSYAYDHDTSDQIRVEPYLTGTDGLELTTSKDHIISSNDSLLFELGIDEASIRTEEEELPGYYQSGTYADAPFCYYNCTGTYTPSLSNRLKLGGALTVEGMVKLGAVLNHAATQTQNYITGEYNVIDVNGNAVEVSEGGQIVSYGLLTDSSGDGSLTIKQGGSVTTDFMVDDFYGGTDMLIKATSRSSMQTPFMFYKLAYLDVLATIEYGGTLLANCVLYSGSSGVNGKGMHFSTQQAIVRNSNSGDGSSGGLLEIEKTGGSISITPNSGNSPDDLGTYESTSDYRSTLTLNGRIGTNSMNLTFMGLSVTTDYIYFPITRYLEVDVRGSDSVLTIGENNYFKILPNTSVDLYDGAAFCLNADLTTYETVPSVDSATLYADYGTITSPGSINVYVDETGSDSNYIPIYKGDTANEVTFSGQVNVYGVEGVSSDYVTSGASFSAVRNEFMKEPTVDGHYEVTEYTTVQSGDTRALSALASYEMNLTISYYRRESDASAYRVYEKNELYSSTYEYDGSGGITISNLGYGEDIATYDGSSWTLHVGTTYTDVSAVETDSALFNDYAGELVTGMDENGYLLVGDYFLSLSLDSDTMLHYYTDEAGTTSYYAKTGTTSYLYIGEGTKYDRTETVNGKVQKNFEIVDASGETIFSRGLVRNVENVYYFYSPEDSCWFSGDKNVWLSSKFLAANALWYVLDLSTYGGSYFYSPTGYGTGEGRLTDEYLYSYGDGYVFFIDGYDYFLRSDREQELALTVYFEMAQGDSSSVYVLDRGLGCFRKIDSETTDAEIQMQFVIIEGTYYLIEDGGYLIERSSYTQVISGDSSISGVESRAWIASSLNDDGSYSYYFYVTNIDQETSEYVYAWYYAEFSSPDVKGYYSWGHYGYWYYDYYYEDYSYYSNGYVLTLSDDASFYGFFYSTLYSGDQTLLAEKLNEDNGYGSYYISDDAEDYVSIFESAGTAIGTLDDFSFSFYVYEQVIGIEEKDYLSYNYTFSEDGSTVAVDYENPLHSDRALIGDYDVKNVFVLENGDKFFNTARANFMFITNDRAKFMAAIPETAPNPEPLWYYMGGEKQNSDYPDDIVDLPVGDSVFRRFNGPMHYGRNSGDGTYYYFSSEWEIDDDPLSYGNDSSKPDGAWKVRGRTLTTGTAINRIAQIIKYYPESGEPGYYGEDLPIYLYYYSSSETNRNYGFQASSKTYKGYAPYAGYTFSYNWDSEHGEYRWTY